MSARFPRSARGISIPLVALATFLFLAACASSGSRTSRSSSQPVTREDIQEISASDAYEALQRLRPRWLRSRGPVSIEYPDAGYPVVYVDEVRWGTLDALRRIDVYSVEQIEFIGAGDATTRFGLNHTGGIIMVSTRP